MRNYTAEKCKIVYDLSGESVIFDKGESLKNGHRSSHPIPFYVNPCAVYFGHSKYRSTLFLRYFLFQNIHFCYLCKVG